MSDKLELIRKRLDARAKQAATEPLFEMTNNDERERVWRAIEANGLRIDKLQATLEAIQASMPRSMLTDEESRYVQLGFKRQLKNLELKQKIIDGGVMGLLAIIAGGLFILVKEWAQAHGFKP